MAQRRAESRRRTRQIVVLFRIPDTDASASLVDFYQRLWRRPDLSEKHQLKLTRWLTLTYGALVIVLAFLVQHLGTLLEATNKVIGLIGGPLIGLFLLGILFRRTTARGALIGWIGGMAMTIWVCFGTNISFLWYAMVGCIVTISIGYVVSLFEQAPIPKYMTDMEPSERKCQPPHIL